MADPRRLLIIEAMKVRAQAIRTADGYYTDAGLNVLVNELPKFGRDDPKVAIVMLVGEDVIDEQQLGKIWITLPFDFVVFAEASLADPNREAELVLADLKKAIELDDRTLGGLLTGTRNRAGGLARGTTEVYHRQNGSEAAGRLISYGAHFAEAWGQPDA